MIFLQYIYGFLLGYQKICKENKQISGNLGFFLSRLSGTGLFSVGKRFCVKHGSDLFPHDPTSVPFDFHPKTTYVLLENHINRFTKQGKQEVC